MERTEPLAKFFIGWLTTHVERGCSHRFRVDPQDIPVLLDELRRRDMSTTLEALQDPGVRIRLLRPLWVNQVVTYVDGVRDYQAVLEGTLEIQGQSARRRDMVRLQVTHLDYDRLEVRIRPNYETLAGYVDALATDICQTWHAKVISHGHLEVRLAMGQHVDGLLRTLGEDTPEAKPATAADQDGRIEAQAGEKPYAVRIRVPKRPNVLARWVRIWGTLARFRGASIVHQPAEVLAWLKKTHRDLVSTKSGFLSVDTISDILAAGRNGLLDGYEIAQE